MASWEVDIKTSGFQAPLQSELPEKTWRSAFVIHKLGDSYDQASLASTGLGALRLVLNKPQVLPLHCTTSLWQEQVFRSDLCFFFFFFIKAPFISSDLCGLWKDSVLVESKEIFTTPCSPSTTVVLSVVWDRRGKPALIVSSQLSKQ